MTHPLEKEGSGSFSVIDSLEKWGSGSFSVAHPLEKGVSGSFSVTGSLEKGQIERTHPFEGNGVIPGGLVALNTVHGTRYKVQGTKVQGFQATKASGLSGYQAYPSQPGGTP